MQARRAILAAVLVCGLPATTVRADELPRGKFGLVTGPRQNTGRLGDSFGFGWLVGIGAGYQPRSVAQSFSMGASWEVLWGWFGADDPEIVDTPLSVLEMNFGLRLRRSLGQDQPRFLALTGGVTALRTSAPIDPDQSRLHGGGYLGLGFDLYVSSRYLLSFETRYGMIGGGPQSLSLMMTVAVGSP